MTFDIKILTLKDIFKRKKIYVAKWEDEMEEAYSRITVFDARKRKPLIRVLRFDEKTEIYFGNQKQNLDSDIEYQILDDVDALYQNQCDQRRDIKARAARKEFEQRKKAVYKEFLKQTQK